MSVIIQAALNQKMTQKIYIQKEHEMRILADSFLFSLVIYRWSKIEQKTRCKKTFVVGFI